MILALGLACTGARTPAASDSDPVPDSGPSPICPPPAPYGLAEGDSATDVQAASCDSTPESLHGLCGQPALVVNWYGWCPSCEDNAELARSLAADHPTLRVVSVLTENPLSAPVDAEFCASYAAAHPSAAEVWMDPDAALEVYGDTDLVLVLAASGKLTFVRQTSTATAIEAAVEAAAGD